MRRYLDYARAGAIMLAALLACVLLLLTYPRTAAAQDGRIEAGLVVDSGGKVIEMVFPEPADSGAQPFPRYFTFYSNDATAFWIQRRFPGGIRDTVPVPIPAGRSIKIPAPTPVLDADGTDWRITIFVGGHTDSVFALPWYE